MAKDNPSIPKKIKGPAAEAVPTSGPISPKSEDKSPVTSKKTNLTGGTPQQRDEHRRPGVDF